MLNQAPAQRTRVDRAATNAPSLLLAYATYLFIAAITVSAGGRVPPLLVWSAVASVVFMTSRSITAGWSLYNGVAAALFFASFGSKPFGDVHIHHLAWLAVIALVVISFMASIRHHGHVSTPGSLTSTRKAAVRLPWIEAIPPIDARALSIDERNKEETWRT